jgi:hypothetical protein
MFHVHCVILFPAASLFLLTALLIAHFKTKEDDISSNEVVSIACIARFCILMANSIIVTSGVALQGTRFPCIHGHPSDEREDLIYSKKITAIFVIIQFFVSLIAGFFCAVRVKVDAVLWTHVAWFSVATLFVIYTCAPDPEPPVSPILHQVIQRANEVLVEIQIEGQPHHPRAQSPSISQPGQAMVLAP